jgi:hypothetical protein
MTTDARPGPFSIEGLKPPMLGPVTPTGAQPAIGIPDNPDFGPSLSWMGFGIRDPRYLQRIGMGANVAGGYPNQDCGWLLSGPGVMVLDQVPSAILANNIATVQHVVSGTPMVLTAGTGLTKLTSVFSVLPTGNVVPVNALAIDGNPAWQGAGQSGAFAFFDPTKGMSRVISVTGVGAGAGGAFKIVGYDVYGNLIHETLTLAAGVNTVNTVKCYKWVAAVIPQFTDPQNVTVGLGDVFGLPLFSATWPGMFIYWGTPPATLISSPTGFTAGVTSTGTATSGDVRGSYAAQSSASDGTKRFSVWQKVPFAAATASGYATAVNNLVGVAQFVG